MRKKLIRKLTKANLSRQLHRVFGPYRKFMLDYHNVRDNATINLPVSVDTIIASFIKIRRTAAVNRDILSSRHPASPEFAENGKDNNTLVDRGGKKGSSVCALHEWTRRVLHSSHPVVPYCDMRARLLPIIIRAWIIASAQGFARTKLTREEQYVTRNAEFWRWKMTSHGQMWLRCRYPDASQSISLMMLFR